MSINHSLNKNSIKKIKLEEADENVRSIAKYKRLAILKFCNESDTKKFQSNNFFIKDDIHALGICCYF